MDATLTTAEARLAEVVGALNVLHGELVALVADVAERGLWHQYDGIRSLAHWLGWQLGCSPATAHDLIRLAEARRTHPAVSQLLVDGQVSFDQAAAAVRARPECDTVMSHLAPNSTVSQIRLEVRVANAGLTPPSPPDGADTEAEPPAETRPREAATLGRTETGQWWLSATLDAERGELVDKALCEARDRLFRGGRTDVTWADALVDIAERSLGASPSRRRNLYRTNIFIHADGHGHLTDHTPLPDAITRQLSCDGVVCAILMEAGLPVSVGRSQRMIPEATRRVVIHRDRGRCRNPACHSRHGLEIHHIVHWHDGGETSTWNLITLCSGCHHLHHSGRLGISGNADDPDGISFTDRRGSPLARLRPNPPATLPPPPAQPYRHPIGERLQGHAMAGIFPDPFHSN